MLDIPNSSYDIQRAASMLNNYDQPTKLVNNKITPKSTSKPPINKNELLELKEMQLKI